MAMHSQNNNMQQIPQQQMQGQQQMQNPQVPMSMGFDQNDPQAWSQQMDMMAQNQQAGANDDAWSNSSGGRHNPIVPTTLNVEDWYVFLQNSNVDNPDLLSYLSNQPAAFPT